MKVARVFFRSPFLMPGARHGQLLNLASSRIASGIRPGNIDALFLTQHVGQALHCRVSINIFLWLRTGVGCHGRRFPIFVKVKRALQYGFRVFGTVYVHQALIAQGPHNRVPITNSVPYANAVTVFLYSRVIEKKDIPICPGKILNPLCHRMAREG